MWVEINNDARLTCNDSQIQFKTIMLKSSICDYSDAYILVSRTRIITTDRAGADHHVKQLDGRNKEVVFQTCPSFIKYLLKILKQFLEDS